jgi:dsDNA-specific endonuclease/ATPase MutS2
MKFVREGCFSSSAGYSLPVFKVNAASDKSDPMNDHLDPVEIIRALKQKGDVKPTQRQKKQQQPEVVDLHAEEIFSSLEGLTPGEILQGQIGRFELSLDLALKSGRGGKMVFIHGVGSGKLKYEIKKILTTKYKRLRFQDASFAEYGYGAIMIFLK